MVEDFLEDFILNLKYYRKQNNLSQAKLAELCGCSTSTIGCIESRKQLPSFDLLFKIASVLHINPADLFIRDCSKLKDSERSQCVSNIIHKIAEIPEHKQEKIVSIFSQICDVYTAKQSKK